MPRFYLSSSLNEHSQITAPDLVAQHVRVLRLREGDGITLFTGQGGEYAASLHAIGKREVEIAIHDYSPVEREALRSATLMPALLANDRMDWLVQKATELGVRHIQPVLSERSQRIPGDVEKRRQHWLAIAIAACEQCGRNRIPEISLPAPLKMLQSQLSAAPTYLLDMEGDSLSPPHHETANFLIGPEGGFSPSELVDLRARCSKKMRLGATVLRAETAALAALSQYLL